MAYVTFTADGAIDKCQLVGDATKNLGIEIDAGVWHAAVCLSPRALEFRTRVVGADRRGSEKQLGGVPLYGSTDGV
eukprot:CAMPEP_0196745938 /NCGR_PEP_ID=MMETSP1091-20130531/63740_1 /TAXON_ID=302021 /ORGANISM="Rhodomonas sp., Strain CCMP768" /LENGTH=75 /DNA_ID=CAMNT_0042092803 /DNA_START=63 /DNA_END=287 /DNA_ORIENTATION=+